jgi:hypothetical protein
LKEQNHIVLAENCKKLKERISKETNDKSLKTIIKKKKIISVTIVTS